MTLQTDLSAQLDSASLVTTLLGALTGATADLRNIVPGLSATDIATASGAAGSINLSGINTAVAGVLQAMGGVIAGLPVSSDLVAPIRTGMTALGAVVAGDLEGGLRAAIDRVGAEFDSLEKGGALGAMRQLAESLQSAPELLAVRDAIAGLFGIAQPGPLPIAPIGAAITSILSALDAIGIMMTLETALAEARRLAALMPSQLGEGQIDALSQTIAAASDAAAAALTGIDPADPVAAEAAITALVTLRRAEAALVDALLTGMGFGEATLSLMDPGALVAQAEAVLQRLRGIATSDIAAALGGVAVAVAPMLTVDLSGAPVFSLAALLGQLEARAADLAAGVATLDTGPITAPLTEGLGRITAVVDDIQAVLDSVLAAVDAALGQVRAAVAGLPLDQIVTAVREIVDVISGVLATLGDVLGTVQATVTDAADAATAALEQAEQAVDTFRDGIETAFATARDFVDGLGLDAVVGAVADAVQTVSDLIGQADMAPYFATAVGAIDGASGVIEKVPFALLPDSMEQDIVDLIRPIKSTDLAAFESQILQVLQIEPDGTFALRPDLEAAVAGVQQKLDALIAALELANPQRLAAAINSGLGDIRAEIDLVSPGLELGAVTAALDRAKAAVAGLDVQAVLQPLSDGFDTVLAAIDGFRPSDLIAPLDAEIDTLRQNLLDLTRLTQWRDQLDQVRTEALTLVNLIDPAQLEPALIAAFDQMQQRLAAGDVPDLLAPLGAILGAMMAGGGASVAPEAIDRVLGWLRGTVGGGAQMALLTDQIRAAIAQTSRVVALVDPGALLAQVAATTTRLTGVVSTLAAGPGRDRLAAAVRATDQSAALRQIGPNHQRYLGFLSSSEAAAANLATKGFAEVDSVSGVLRAGFAPLAPLLQAPRDALARLGFTRADQGLSAILAELFAVATPARLAGILTPVFTALHGRVETLLDSLITPLRDLIDRLVAVIGTFDLSPLAAALDAVHATVRAEIAALHPDTLLGGVLSGFTDAQAAVAAFDPLGPVIALLDALKATILRVLAKLDGNVLLAAPTQIFASIRGSIGGLDLGAILDPLFARLDAIAGQVSVGLDDTVTAFGRLQDALPGQIGSTSVSASASVGG